MTAESTTVEAKALAKIPEACPVTDIEERQYPDFKHDRGTKTTTTTCNSRIRGNPICTGCELAGGAVISNN